MRLRPFSFLTFAFLAAEIAHASDLLQPAPDADNRSDSQYSTSGALKTAALRALKEHTYSDAVERAQAAVSLMPNDFDALALLALSRIRNGDYLDAKTIINRLPPSELGRYGLNHAIRALSLMEEADGLLERAYTSGSRDLYVRATHYIEQAAKHDQIDEVYDEILGWLYLEKLDEPERAYHHLKTYLRTNHADVEANKLLALACARTNRDREARELYSTITAQDPTDQWMAINSAKLSLRLHHFAEAKHQLATIVASAPDNLDARLGLLQLSSRSGERTLALIETSKLADSNPNTASPEVLLGSLYLEDQELAKAKQHFEEALAIMPSEYDAKAGLATIRELHSWILNPTAYQFRDSTALIRQVQQITATSPLWHHTRFTFGFGHWTFHQLPNSIYTSGTDLQNAIELLQSSGWRTRYDRSFQVHHFISAAIDFTINFLQYNYEPHHYTASISSLFQWKPRNSLTLYLSAASREPVADNLNTAKNGFARSSLGAGVERVLTDVLSLQSEVLTARYTDGNAARSGMLQLSWQVTRSIASSLHFRADVLAFDRPALDYFSPSLLPIYRIVYEAAPKISKNLSISAKAGLPLVSSRHPQFGIETEIGAGFHASDHLQLKASYYTEKIPTAVQWSGRGFRLQGDVRR